MKNKVLKLLCLLLSLFIFWPGDVDAKRLDQVGDFYKCDESKLCVVLCSYYTRLIDFDFDGVVGTDGIDYSDYAEAYIVYHYDKGVYSITHTHATFATGAYNSDEWGGDELEVTYDSNGKATDVSSDKGTIWLADGAVEGLINNGTCPANLYFDIEGGMLGQMEVCFDNDGKYCQSADDWDPGTAFKYLSDTGEKLYDNIIQYFNSNPTKVLYDGVDVTNVSATTTDATITNKLNPLCDQLVNGSMSSTEKKEFIENLFTYPTLSNFEKEVLGSENANSSFLDSWPAVIAAKEAHIAAGEKTFENIFKYCENKIRNDEQLAEEERQQQLEELERQQQEMLEDYKQQAEELLDSIFDGDFVPMAPDETCEDFLGLASVDGTPAYYIDLVFDIVKVVVVLALIILSMFDLVTAITKEMELAPVFKKIIYRLVLVIIILLLPTLINLVAELLTGKSNILCGIG